MSIVVLGSGMAAMGAASFLREHGREPVLYDKNSYPGGHTASFVSDNGFVFDDGPHISFTKNERIQAMLADNIGGEYETLQCRVNNHWKGHWIKHPAQCNLYGLPQDLIDRVLAEFEALEGQETPRPDNYAQWLLSSFGETFSTTFPMRYGLKYHTCPAELMTTDWLGPRLYRPDLEEVRYGATHPETPDVHYVTHFRYPSRHGFYHYLAPWVAKSDLHLNHRLVSVHPAERRLDFANGTSARYEQLISSIPLPELISMIAGVPGDVLEASRRLACTQCLTVNVGVGREDVSDHHWTYFYDEDYCFARLSFPHLFSPHTVPAGASAIQAECYFSDKYRPLDITPEQCVAAVLADLKRCGILRENDPILLAEARLVRYANIIFDQDRPAALALVHGYLDEIGIAWAGRYGEWGYQWTDEAFTSGERAAARVIERFK